MRRTRTRPVAAGRMGAAQAASLAAAQAGAGLATLAVGANFLAAGVAAFALLSYVLVYTPLKRRTPLSTLVGGVPGGLPPMIGWTAATGTLSAGGWVLFAIVPLWQMPHFLALARLCRDDYARAGLPLLPVVEPDGRRTGRQALLYASALLPAGPAPTLAGLTGRVYFGAALAIGLAFLVFTAQFATRRTTGSARRLFIGSVAYLPLLWAAMLLDH